MRLLNSKANSPEYAPGVHTVKIVAPADEAVRIVQADLHAYVNCGRVIDVEVESRPCTVGRSTTYIYETWVTYEVFA